MNDNKINYKKTKQLLEQYALDYEQTLKNRLIAAGKNASGELLKSIEVKVMRLGEYWTIKLNVVDYFKWVENGRKPGKQPPIEAMIKWIRFKKIIPKPNNKGKIPNEKQLAFLIARSIGKNGIKPSYCLRYTKSAMTQKYSKLLKQALTDDYSDYVKTNFRTIVINNKKNK